MKECPCQRRVKIDPLLPLGVLGRQGVSIQPAATARVAAGVDGGDGDGSASSMRLSMRGRKAVTRVTATRYRAASKGMKTVILDELCQTTGWHRDHARKALRQGVGPRSVVPVRKPRPSIYGEDVMEPLR